MRTSTWWLAVGACLSIPSAAAYGDQAGASASPPKLVIGVVVDVRPDQMPVIDFERQVVNAISSAFEGLSAEGFVVAYSDRVQWITDVSTLESALRDGGRRINADSIVVPPFASVLNDGVAEGLERLASKAGAVRKALIVVGEGNDGASSTKFSTVLQRAKGDSVQCFALFVATHRSQVGRIRQYGFDLMRLASATHGKIYDVRTEPERLDKAVTDLKRRLVPQS
jgi:hypothetical protein